MTVRAADDAEVRPLSPELREKCLTVLRTALEEEEFVLGIKRRPTQRNYEKK